MPYTPPPDLVRRAKAVAAGREDAAELREAATVVLLRDPVGRHGPVGKHGHAAGSSQAHPQIFMLRRRRQLAFAGGMLVFPGGKVEDHDASLPDELVGPGLGRIADAFATTVDRARRHVVAAVREVLEETGVLLATGSQRDARIARQAREALEDGSLSLAEILNERSAVIDPTALVPWAHWVTPRFEPRRFDTWFFAARLAAHGDPDADTGEAEGYLWGTPEQILDQLKRKEVAMMPPTRHTLHTLARGRSAADLLSDPPDFRRVAPGWVEREGRFELITNSDPDYPGGDPLEGS